MLIDAWLWNEVINEKLIPCVDKEFCWWNTTLYIHVDNTKKLKFVRRKFNLENCSLCLKIAVKKRKVAQSYWSHKRISIIKENKLSFELTNIIQKKKKKERVYQLSFRSTFYAFKFEEAWKRKIKIIYKWYVSVQISNILPPTKIAIIFVVIWWNVIFHSLVSLSPSNWTNVGTFWYLCKSLCWFFYFAILLFFFFFLLHFSSLPKSDPKLTNNVASFAISLRKKYIHLKKLVT